MTTTILPSAPRTRTARLLEGEHRWGRLEESSALFTARTGVRVRRLVVYAPGADAADRRILTLWRSWPAVGGALAFAVALGLAPTAPAAALAGMLAVYVGGIVMVARRSRRARRACRSVKCSSVQLSTGEETLGDEDRLDEAFAELVLLERLRDRGRITEVGFELGWARVYDSLGTRG